MKIDFLISRLEIGGAERVVSILANYLNKEGYTVRIITFRGSKDYDIDEGIERIRLHRQPVFKSVVFSGFFSLLSFYRKKENRPDIISSHINHLGFMTIPIARIYGIKIIVSEHNNYLSRYTFEKRILWYGFYPLADAVTILTSFDMEFFKKKNKRVLVMPNPSSFDLDTDRSPVAVMKKEVLAIGQLNRYHQKGFDNLLIIAREVLKAHPDWKFKIVGAGEHGTLFLKEQAKEMGIEESIVFTGFQTNVKAIINESDIFILPSRFEGLPMTLLEAMSQGIPCIAFDCVSGPSDIIHNDENGLLIENQNIKAMVEGVCKLIENEDLRNKFRQNAPDSIKDFSIESVGKKWEDLISDIVTAK